MVQCRVLTHPAEAESWMQASLESLAVTFSLDGFIYPSASKLLLRTYHVTGPVQGTEGNGDSSLHSHQVRCQAGGLSFLHADPEHRSSAVHTGLDTLPHCLVLDALSHFTFLGCPGTGPPYTNIL
jgi:hypothetical protein